MNGCWKELITGVRSLACRPGFCLLVVVTLAIGVGTNATIFSAVYAVLLKRLPFQAEDRVVAVEMFPSEELRERLKTETEPTSWEDFLDWKAQNTVFDSMAGYVRIDLFGSTVVSGPGENLTTDGCEVTSDFLPVLGVEPVLGRLFEDRDHDERVAVLSHSLWQRLFGGTPDAIGQTIRINAVPHTVVGVTPGDFRYDHKLLWLKVRPDVWVPLNPAKYAGQRGNFVVGVVARLKPGISVERADQEMRMIGENIRRVHVKHPDWAVRVRPIRESLFGHNRPILLLLFAAVGLVLLIACANTGTLLLARNIERQNETAVRMALGARRFHIVVKFAGENLLPVGLGGCVGLLLALAGTQMFNAFCRNAEFDWPPLSVNLPVIGFGILLTLTIGMALSLLPIVTRSKPNLQNVLRQATSSSSQEERRLTRLLVVAEVALSLVLLVGATVVVRSFVLLCRLDTGLQAEKVLTMAVSIPASTREERIEKARRILELPDRISSIPGIVSAANVAHLPGTGAPQAGRVNLKGVPGPSVNYLVVSEDYFRVMGIEILGGRSFIESDVTGAGDKAIISQSLAELLGASAPVDMEVEIGSRKRRIVGVVRDVRQDGLITAVKPQIYLFDKRHPEAKTNLVVQTKGDTLALTPHLLEEVKRLDPDLSVSKIRTMERVFSSSVADRQMATLLMSLFGVVALFLAAVGLGGVIAGSVSRRTREISVRMALGARSSQIMAMVLKEAMFLALFGILLGGVAAVAVVRIASGQLFGLAEADPSVFAVSSSLLFALSLVSALWPALRASRTAPLQVLRHE
jgi:putative ABC transport system permease protein